jgi:hypothetical protein
MYPTLWDQHRLWLRRMCPTVWDRFLFSRKDERVRQERDPVVSQFEKAMTTECHPSTDEDVLPQDWRSGLRVRFDR